MELHINQKPIASSKARFTVERCGRRFGKTTVKTERMLFKAISNTIRLARPIKDRSVIFIAPTQKQARTIVWEAFKARLHNIGEFNESRLEIRIPTEDGGKSTVFVGGWENRENYRGMPNVIHIEFDELDTMKDFFIGYQEIFRPMLIDTGGSAGFGGTPQKENTNLRRLEKQYEKDPEWEFFHYTTADNPHVPRTEIIKAQEEMDSSTYKQEILAQYVDHAGSLFKYTALIDLFSNTITKDPEKYLIVDIADDGSDKTIFNFFQGLESYRIEEFAHLNTEGIIDQIREYAAGDQIPYSQIAVDAIGVGAGVASSSLLDGIIGYKSSYSPIKTDIDPTRLPNVHYTKNATLTTEYANLRSQCVFILAGLVNEHKIAVKTGDVRIKERIIEELAVYQDASKGDGKRMATQKDDVKTLIGRSPDISDTLIMRMYFEIKARLVPGQSQEAQNLARELNMQFARNQSNMSKNSTK